MGILDHIIVACLGKLPVGETVDGSDIVLPDVDNLDILLGKILNGVLGLGCGLDSEEFGTYYNVSAKVICLLQTVLKHILEEECVGEQSSAGTEAAIVIVDIVFRFRITAQIAVHLVVSKRPVKGALGPVVEDHRINLSINLLAVYDFGEVSAVAGLD